MFHWFKKHTQGGLETPDPTPLEITLKENYQRPLTIAEQIARFTQARDFQEAVERHGLDTLEDADDTEVEDETEPLFGRTPYEMREDDLDGVQTHLDEIRGGAVQDISEERMEKARSVIRQYNAKAKGQRPAAVEPFKEEGSKKQEA